MIPFRQLNKPANDATKMCVFIHGEQDLESNKQIGYWNNIECDRGPDGSGGKRQSLKFRGAKRR